MFFVVYNIVLALVVSVDSLVDADGIRRVGSREVATKYGMIRGVLVTLPNKNIGPVEVFLGIPFASPPVGMRRFMPPVEPIQWHGVRAADRYSPVCPQRLPDIRNETESLQHMPAGRLEYLRKLVPFLRNQSEDCLYLNVYCPAKKQPSRLPVIMFIHGDSYEFGSGNPYDGTVLAGFGEVIVITLNYRLGILGFLPYMDGASGGNYGLLDIIAALHWVQENIAQFGGDPRNITLLGHGYGASCAHLLMISPRSKGLFQRVVLQSGSAFSPWAIANEPMTFARNIARKLGCPVTNHSSLVNCLRNRSLTDIMRVTLVIPAYLTAFGPTVDGTVIPEEPEKLLLHPANDYERGPKPDILIGCTRSESFFDFGSFDEKYGIEPVRRDRILRTLVRNLFIYHLQEIFLTIVNEYTDWARPVQHPLNILDATVQALTDALYVAPSISSANALSKLKHRTYLYVFNHPTDESDYPQRLVSVHGEDIPFLFGAPLVSQLSFFKNNFTRQEVTLSEIVMLFWTNFAKYGNPNIVRKGPTPSKKPRNKFEKLQWPVYDSVNQKYYSIASKPRIRDHYHAHRLSFWLSLIPKLHRQGTAPGISSQHHLLEDHDNPLTYDGIVRQGPVLPISYLSTLSQHAQTAGVPTRVPATQLRVNFDRPTVSSGIEISVPHVLDTSSTFYSSSREDELPQTPVPSSVNVSSSLASSDSSNISFFLTPKFKKIIGVMCIIGFGLLGVNIIACLGFFFRRKWNERNRNRNRNRDRNRDLESNQDRERQLELELRQREPPPPPPQPPPTDLELATALPEVKSPFSPPSPDGQRALEMSHVIPPPIRFIQPVSPNSNASVVPSQDSENKPALTSDGHHTPGKVHWAPDVGFEADRDAVWL